MNLDLLLRQLQLGGQELGHLDSLVALHLDDLSQGLVLDDVSVTGKVLLQDLQDLLQVVLRRQSLHSGQSLTTITLLDTNVDVVGLLRLRISGVSERIWRLVNGWRLDSNEGNIPNEFKFWIVDIYGGNV